MKRRVKTQLTRTVFFQATDLSGKIYTDQTGRFPVTSSRGFKYIMVAYDHDSNTIHAKPMKNCSGPEILKGYITIHNLLSERGLAIFHGFGMNFVGVVVVGDHDVFETAALCDGE